MTRTVQIIRLAIGQTEIIPIIRIGQIWREVDPRFTRFVRILSINKSMTMMRRGVEVRTVESTGDRSAKNPYRWEFTKHSRATWCDRERFNGKRGGYELYEDAP